MTPKPFGFAGQHGYQSDSTGLMRLGHRFYDASTGRFLSRDPIHDGYNWYGYCDGDPVNEVDPEGLVNWARVRHGIVVGFKLFLDVLGMGQGAQGIGGQPSTDYQQHTPIEVSVEERTEKKVVATKKILGMAAVGVAMGMAHPTERTEAEGAGFVNRYNRGEEAEPVADVDSGGRALEEAFFRCLLLRWSGTGRTGVGYVLRIYRLSTTHRGRNRQRSGSSHGSHRYFQVCTFQRKQPIMSNKLPREEFDRRYLLARKLLKDGRYQQANALLRDLLFKVHTNEDSGNVLYSLGESYDLLGYTRQAAPLYWQSIRFLPAQMLAYMKLKTLYKQQRDWRGYIRVYLVFWQNFPHVLKFLRKYYADHPE